MKGKERVMKWKERVVRSSSSGTFREMKGKERVMKWKERVVRSSSSGTLREMKGKERVVRSSLSLGEKEEWQ